MTIRISRFHVGRALASSVSFALTTSGAVSASRLDASWPMERIVVSLGGATDRWGLPAVVLLKEFDRGVKISLTVSTTEPTVSLGNLGAQAIVGIG